MSEAPSADPKETEAETPLKVETSVPDDDVVETPLEENLLTSTQLSSSDVDKEAKGKVDDTQNEDQEKEGKEEEGDKEEELKKEDHDDDDDSSIVQPLLTKNTLTLSQQLITSKKVRNMSLFALRLGCLADSVNTVILRPNYPFMVLPPGPDNPDSFPSTEPFEFGAAQYFLPLSSQLATALAATFVGALSDKVGRRPVMLVCVGFGVFGSIAKYLARNSFWGFCAANFVTGLFGATLAISMAYASDIALSRHEKDGMIGSLVAIQMVGATGGGIIAIAMSNVGLYEPLLVGAAFNLLATIFGFFYLIEPNKLLHLGVLEAVEEDDKMASDEDAVAATATLGETTEAGSSAADAEKDPDKLDWKVTSNILAGSLLDNAGSTGYIPFCLSPLMFNTYLLDFVAQGLNPVMSDNAFRWISTLLALMIIPAAAGTTALYERIGAAVGCVLGNFFTGVFTIVLLLIATLTDPTTGSYALYITVMYVGFPLTVISQLSTGPMLDRISPTSKRGFTQGLNTSIMNLGQAIFPWVFGLMSDGVGVETTIWVCIGISFAAAIVNSPLMFTPALKPVPRIIELPEYSRHIPDMEEDPELISKALRGEWVPPNVLHDINDRRLVDGHQFLVLPYKSYQEDKETHELCNMGKHSKEDFQFFREIMTGYLSDENLHDPIKREKLTKRVQKSRPPIQKRKELASELGQWFADYLLDAGYQVDDSPFILKQMIMRYVFCTTASVWTISSQFCLHNFTLDVVFSFFPNATTPQCVSTYNEI